MLEIHGNLSQALCAKCSKKISSELLLEKIENSVRRIPFCDCGGVFKPDVVLFGEMLSNLNEAVGEASKADLFLAIGSSLQVSPANLLPEYSLARQGELVIINYMETHLDHRAAVVVREDIGTFLTEGCKYLGI